jgi:hypothetical protein
MLGQAMQHSQSLAAGLSIPVAQQSAFAATLAVCRFFANKKTTLSVLAAPLQQFARQQLADEEYVLLVHDWSRLKYKNHTAKTDTREFTNKDDVGYDLLAQLAVNATNGSPIALLQAAMRTQKEFFSTLNRPLDIDTPHLEQVLPMMQATKKMKLGCKRISVIDREADAVLYLRQWDEAGELFLVRCDDDRNVQWNGQDVFIREITASAERESSFTFSREVAVKGNTAKQFVFETEMTLTRPAFKTRKGQKPVLVPGNPLTLRLVIAKVIEDKSGAVHYWYLLTNVSPDVSSERIALWYYYRWQIENYFKLLKSGGQELEHWQQESGLAILKRLLVVSMACSVVWSLQRNTSIEAEELKAALVKLSGKSQKRGRPPTAGTLLSGLFVLIRMFDFSEWMQNDTEKINNLRSILQKLIPKN